MSIYIATHFFFLPCISEISVLCFHCNCFVFCFTFRVQMEFHLQHMFVFLTVISESFSSSTYIIRKISFFPEFSFRVCIFLFVYYHYLKSVMLQIMAVTSHAALSPEQYWKTVLPSTPMPGIVKHLLHPGLYWRPQLLFYITFNRKCIYIFIKFHAIYNISREEIMSDLILCCWLNSHIDFLNMELSAKVNDNSLLSKIF